MDGLAYRDRLDTLGIDTQGVRHIEGAFTAQAFIITDLDDNQITAFHPGAMTRSHENDVGRVKGVGWGIVAPDGRDGMLKHAAGFRAAGVPYIFDPGQGMTLFAGDELLEMIEGRRSSRATATRAKLLCDRTSLTLDEIANPCDALVVTMGGEGSVIHTESGTMLIPKRTPRRSSIDAAAAMPTAPDCCTGCQGLGLGAHGAARVDAGRIRDPSRGARTTASTATGAALYAAYGSPPVIVMFRPILRGRGTRAVASACPLPPAGARVAGQAYRPSRRDGLSKRSDRCASAARARAPVRRPARSSEASAAVSSAATGKRASSGLIVGSSRPFVAGAAVEGGATARETGVGAPRQRGLVVVVQDAAIDAETRRRVRVMSGLSARVARASSAGRRRPHPRTAVALPDPRLAHGAFRRVVAGLATQTFVFPRATADRRRAITQLVRKLCG
jgi:hypothetical protein